MFSCYLAANVINLSLLQSDPRWIDNLLSFQEWLAWISPEHFIRCRLYSLWSVALEILNWICNCNNKIGEFLIYLSCLDPALWAYNSWVHVIFISYFANLTPPHTNVIVTHCLILERKRSDAWPCFHPSVFGHILPMPGCDRYLRMSFAFHIDRNNNNKNNINNNNYKNQHQHLILPIPGCDLCHLCSTLIEITTTTSTTKWTSTSISHLANTNVNEVWVPNW